MGAIEKLNKKLVALEVAINETIRNTILSDEDFIINQQSSEQWYNKGQYSTTTSIVPKYATSTIKIKDKKFQPVDRVTLRDTGRMYKSIFVDALANEMIISVNVTYFKWLVKRYEKDETAGMQGHLLGLNQAFINSFVTKRVLPNIKKEWKKIIKSK